MELNFIEKSDWESLWIWNSKSNSPDSWVYFEKDFKLSEKPKQAMANIAVDSRYFLVVNGKTAVRFGGLNRGPCPEAGYYDSIDIQKYLQKGENRISVLVWYWGNQGRNNIDSGKGGLMFQASIDNTLIISDSSWKTAIHPAFFITDEPRPSYLYGGHNIGFDARGFEKGIFPIESGIVFSQNTEEIGRYKCEPWGRLYKNTLPAWKDYGLLDYESVSKEIIGDTVVVTSRLPYAAHVCPVFTIESPSEGLFIDVRTDRYEVNGGNGDSHHSYRGHRLSYKTSEGLQQFEYPGWLFGENVEYRFPHDVIIKSLQYREIGYSCTYAGLFECSDSNLNRLVDKAVRTLYVCMMDNYMDCPDRERGQWIGDVSSQVPQTFYALDRYADMLTEKAIRDFILWKKGPVLQGNIPGVHSGELPSQSLNAIGINGMIMSYYMHSGNSDVIDFAYESIKEYLALWKVNNDGSIVNRKGAWDWYDHGEKIDNTVLLHEWYYNAVKSVKLMAGILGKNSDRENYTKLAINLEKSFKELYWTGSGFKSGEYYDDRANGLALLTGLAKESEYADVMEILGSVYNATPYMEGYIIEGMFSTGYGEEALERIRLRYKQLIENENSTLWEDFNLLGTRNHAWSGGVLSVLYRYLAGIYPIEAGYDFIGIEPKLHGLRNLKAHVPSVKGEISITARQEKNELQIKVVIPEGCKARIRIPIKIEGSSESAKVKFSGPKIQKQEKSEDEKYLYFSTSGGEYKFSVFSE